MTGGIVSSLKGYDEQNKITQIIPVVENSIQRALARDECKSNESAKTWFLVVDEKQEKGRSYE